MFNRRNLLFGKGRYLVGSILLLLIITICAAFIMTNTNDFDIAKREVLLRSIGHELLLKSGDSTSRVLPIDKIAENEYRIRFENGFKFEPDHLVNTVRRLLTKDLLTSDYVVNVLNVGQNSVVYGYVISKNKKDDIVPCKGRVQPQAHYSIDIKFKPTIAGIVKNGCILGSLPILAFIGFMFFKSDNLRQTLSVNHYDDILTIGSSLFDTKNRQLITNGRTIDLTRTETRLFHIFALSPNKIVERSRLQKEIWEDDGVIVGRSLDMFISKLRKKLEDAPHIRIVVIRSKGYRLEINT